MLQVSRFISQVIRSPTTDGMSMLSAESKHKPEQEEKEVLNTQERNVTRKERRLWNNGDL